MKRKAFALLATALVGLLAAATASAPSKSSRRSQAQAARFVNPLVQQCIPALGSAYGYSLSTPRSARAPASPASPLAPSTSARRMPR